MAISLASLRTTSVLTPPRILIHGVAGVGKSTFAADADRPVFLMTEDGLGKLQVPHFPLATSYAEVAEALDALLNEDHDFGTVVVRTIEVRPDAAQQFTETCGAGFGQQHGVEGRAVDFQQYARLAGLHQQAGFLQQALVVQAG